MRISIAQIDSKIGDFSGNAEKILSFAEKAHQERADLVLFPELALCGYPPMDLLEFDSFTEHSRRAVGALTQKLPRDMAVGLGFTDSSPYQDGKALVNRYSVFHHGEIVFSAIKTTLSSRDIFDEKRYFESARSCQAFVYQGERIGIVIGEDLWRETADTSAPDPLKNLLAQGISLLCVPSASPFYPKKLSAFETRASALCDIEKIPAVVYINQVGASDSVIFDGGSFIAVPQNAARNHGTGLIRAREFEEDILTWDSSDTSSDSSGAANSIKGEARLDSREASRNDLDAIEEALVLGIRDYCRKGGFTKAHLGLSGGIDSALVAYLAVRALGADNLATFNMPSRFSSQGSKDDAAELAQILGCSYRTLPIESVYKSYLDTLQDVFENRPFDLAEENLQARIRGALMMAYSNKFGSMLLTTGNKSELAMGYCTLYGDMCGALAPIGDLFKTEVFELCRRINQRSREAGGQDIIPESTIIKPPSAELREDQKDQDSLPPYEDLDGILKLYLYENLSKDAIVAQGWDQSLTERILKTVAMGEYKRRQGAPVLQVSPRAFGTGRRTPMVRGIFEIM